MIAGRGARFLLRTWLCRLSVPCCAAFSSCSKAPAEPPDLLTVAVGDAVFRTEASGRIVPGEEVFVHSLVAGQLVELAVRPGDVVQRGAHLATVRVVADPVILGEARVQVRMAETRLASAVRERTRSAALTAGTLLSLRELAQAEDDQQLASTALAGARERVRLISEGVASSGNGRSTRVLATIDGTVLATPVAVGDFVSDMNAYRDGTTVAVLADMRRQLFKGQIEEAHVGRLRIGMPASVKVGALPGRTFEGRLTWIAARATVEQGSGAGHAAPSGSTGATVVPLSSSTAGVTRFEVWVELDAPPPDLRAGYTAAAEFTLERHENVPVVDESALRFAHGKVFARVYEGGRTEEREVTVGVSDGLKIEIVSGLAAGDRIAQYEAP